MYVGLCVSESRGQRRRRSWGGQSSRSWSVTWLRAGRWGPSPAPGQLPAQHAETSLPTAWSLRAAAACWSRGASWCLQMPWGAATVWSGSRGSPASVWARRQWWLPSGRPATPSNTLRWSPRVTLPPWLTTKGFSSWWGRSWAHWYDTLGPPLKQFLWCAQLTSVLAIVIVLCRS